MSADNFLYVRKLPNGQWAVTMEFYSNEQISDVPDYQTRYPNWGEAYRAAQKWEREEDYLIEYGIRSDDAEM